MTADPRRPGRAKRALIVAAVGATLVGLPAVLVAGTLLRHVGHISPVADNAAALRLRLLGHGVRCDDPVTDPRGPGERTALRCTGPDGVRLRLVTYAGGPGGLPLGWSVDGANWRVEVGTGDAARALAQRLATALTGEARLSEI